MFVNPLAGAGRAGRYLLQVRQAFEAKKFPAEFVLTSESAADLELRARAAIVQGRRFLLAMGGDGTLQGLVNAAYGSDVVIGRVASGRRKRFCGGTGIAEGSRRRCARDVERATASKWILLRARTSDGRERLYVGGGGVGLDVDASATPQEFTGGCRVDCVTWRPRCALGGNLRR